MSKQAIVNHSVVEAGGLSMHPTNRVLIIPASRRRCQDSTRCRLQAPASQGTLSPPYRVFCLVLHALLGLLLSADVPPATAQRQRNSETVSLASSPSRPRLGGLEQSPRAPGVPGETLRLPLDPLYTSWTATAVGPPPSPFSVASRRFTLSPTAHDDAEGRVVATADLFYRPVQAMLDPAEALPGMALRVLPLLAWTDDRASAAWPFRVSRFGVPADATPLPVAQVYGAWAVGTRPRGVLQYALYAGVSAAEPPRDLIAGASIGYAVGITGFTLGIGYLYGPHAVGLDVLGSPVPEGVGAGPGRDVPGLLRRLPDQDRLLRDPRWWPGVGTSEQTSVAVRTRAVLYLNHQWAVYHRYDRLSLGQGLPKITTHILGVRFFPVAHVSLQAEVLLGGIDDAMGQAGGVRVAGTLYF